MSDGGAMSKNKAKLFNALSAHYKNLASGGPSDDDWAELDHMVSLLQKSNGLKSDVLEEVTNSLNYVGHITRKYLARENKGVWLLCNAVVKKKQTNMLPLANEDVVATIDRTGLAVDVVEQPDALLFGAVARFDHCDESGTRLLIGLDPCGFDDAVKGKVGYLCLKPPRDFNEDQVRVLVNRLRGSVWNCVADPRNSFCPAEVGQVSIGEDIPPKQRFLDDVISIPFELLEERYVSSKYEGPEKVWFEIGWPWEGLELDLVANPLLLLLKNFGQDVSRQIKHSRWDESLEGHVATLPEALPNRRKKYFNFSEICRVFDEQIEMPIAQDDGLSDTVEPKYQVIGPNKILLLGFDQKEPLPRITVDYRLTLRDMDIRFEEISLHCKRSGDVEKLRRYSWPSTGEVDLLSEAIALLTREGSEKSIREHVSQLSLFPGILEIHGQSMRVRRGVSVRRGSLIPNVRFTFEYSRSTATAISDAAHFADISCCERLLKAELRKKIPLALSAEISMIEKK